MMTTFIDGLLPLLLQVTLWSSIGLVALALVNRFRPERLASIALALFVGIVVLSVLAYMPWPRWVADGLTLQAIVQTDTVPEQQAPTSSGMSFSLAWKNWQSLLKSLPSTSGHAGTSPSSSDWSLLVLGIVFAGILIGLIRLVVAHRYAHWHITQAATINDDELKTLCSELCLQLNMKSSIRLLASPTLQVPATVGWRCPAILLPTCWTQWTKDECRTVLAHELAHIHRADYLVIMLTQCIATIYWFHPLVRLLSRWMRSGQELAADALAVRAHGDQPSYLQSLCRLALSQDGARLPSPARLFLSPEVSLVRRIVMLRDGSLKLRHGKLWLRGMLVCACVGVGLLVASLRGVADEATAPKKATTIDWRNYVDPTAPGYVIMRPSAAMSLPSMEQYRTTLNRMFKNEIDVLPGTAGMGIPLDVIECFAGPVQVTLQKNNEKGTGNLTVRGQFFQLKTAEAAEKWLKHCTYSYVKVEHELGTYYRCNQEKDKEQSGGCFLRPDDRTIVFAETPEELMRWFKSEKPKCAWLAACPADTGIVTTVVDMKHELVKKAVKQGSEGMADHPMLKPLLDHTGGVSCTITLQDKIHVECRFGCANPEAATTRKAQLDAMIVLGKTLMGTEKPQGDIQQTAAEQMAAMLDLIKNINSTVEGNTACFKTHCEMKLGTLLSEQVDELIKGVPKK